MAVADYELGTLLQARLMGEVEARQNMLREVITRDAMHRALAKALDLTNEDGLVHTGLYKQSWMVQRVSNGWELLNSAPYAGVIEHGRRPGRPGPPIAPILRWVQLKLVPNGKIEIGENETLEQATDRAAWAIRNSLHVKGSKPRKVLTRVEGKYLEDFFYSAVDHYLSRFAPVAPERYL